MATVKKKNPFKAGWGLEPPYLAGRQNEIDAIEDALDAIQGGAGQLDHAPDPALVLLGPRGVGKTVLLAIAISEATKRGIHASKIDREALIGPQKALVDHVFPGGVLKKLFNKVNNVKVGIMAVGLKDATSNFKSAVFAYLSKKPLLLVLDEAHHCETEILNQLFGLAQDCLSAKLPFALVIAGTPGLEPLMQRCKATYVERSEILHFNTLSDDEAKEALEIPAMQSGRPIKPGALKLMLGWADNYPYFIQMAGRLAWQASMQRGGKEITIADARAGLAEAGRKRDNFYKNRYNELKKRQLADFATQVIKIMRELGDKADTDALEMRLMEMNDGMDSDQAMKVTEELQELGFLWDSIDGLEPGIFSMFDYVVRRRRAP